jgi:hypothetical protein
VLRHLIQTAAEKYAAESVAPIWSKRPADHEPARLSHVLPDLLMPGVEEEIWRNKEAIDNRPNLSWWTQGEPVRQGGPAGLALEVGCNSPIAGLMN